MSERKTLVVKCNCGLPVHVSMKQIAQVMAHNRKVKNSTEHMKRISALGVKARKNKIK